MLEFRDFFRMAKYANENWNGSFTDEEVAENAYNFYSDYKYIRIQIEGGMPISEDYAYNLASLLVNLKDDAENSDDAELGYWIEEIEEYIELED